jgi:hypothetical protein
LAKESEKIGAKIHAKKLSTMHSCIHHEHPSVFLSASLLYLQSESQFAKQYGKTLKQDLWRYYLADSLFILSILPDLIMKKDLNWMMTEHGNLSWKCRLESLPALKHMTEKDENWILEFLTDFDQDGGHPISHTACLIGSALADPFLCLSSALITHASLSNIPNDSSIVAKSEIDLRNLALKLYFSCFGCLAGSLWKRALMAPIEHPLSTNFDELSNGKF